MTCRVRRSAFGKCILQVDDIDGTWVDAPYNASGGPFEMVSKEKLAHLLLREQRANQADQKAAQDRNSKMLRKQKAL